MMGMGMLMTIVALQVMWAGVSVLMLVGIVMIVTLSHSQVNPKAQAQRATQIRYRSAMRLAMQQGRIRPFRQSTWTAHR